MLIIAGSPFLVFYHTGYVRLSLVPYDLASTEMCVHLTNQYQQKKHPLYKEVKEDTVSLSSSDHCMGAGGGGGERGQKT